MNSVGSDNNLEETIVTELYRSLLGREPDPKYLKQHADKLRSQGIGGGLSDTIRHFLATEEFQRRAIDPNRVSWKIPLNSSRYYLEQINRDFAASIPAGSLVLDVGAGRAPYRNLFKHAQYESADFEKVNKEYGETTYVCDVTEGIPVEDNHFDYLLSNQTLEHINKPAKALKEMHRVLKPGGMMLCSAPLFYEEHEQPYDFFRYTHAMLSATCSSRQASRS